MQAHANDLRAEVAKDWPSLVDDGNSPPDDAALDAFVHQFVDDWRGCALSPGVRRLLEFTEKMTRTPADMTERDVEALREQNWTDTAIHDAVQVIAYFNYINRVADALGIEPEPGLRHWGRRAQDPN